MNIFVTNICPVKSAQYLDNLRLNKMILESAQMLSTALRHYGVTDGNLYSRTHVNHPCSVWARECRANYSWLLAHFKGLAEEKIRRSGKSHKSYDKLYSIFAQYLDVLPEGSLTPFPNCTTYKHVKDVHLAYKLYLSDKWEFDVREPKWS